MDKTKTPTDRELIEPRLGGWNDWPPGQVVSITEHSLDDARPAYEFGYAYGRVHQVGLLRQVSEGQLPTAVRAVLTEHGNRWAHNNVWIGFAESLGQSDVKPHRNLVVVFPPATGYDFKERETVWKSPGLIVEVGCRHTFETRTLGRAWTRSSCTACEYAFEIDSSG